MKTIPLFILAAFISMSFISSCEKKQDTIPGPGYLTSDRKAAQLIGADNIFAWDLLRVTDSLNNRDNYMISPLSVAMALGMTYNGAANETKQAFEHTLRLDGLSRSEINRIHGDLLTWLVRADPEVTLEIANSIWVDHLYTIMKSFADTNMYYYHATVSSLDFSDSRAVETINDWVTEKTHGKITRLLNEIPPEAAMYLINAIYFNGTWKYAFDADKTSDLAFYPGNSPSVNVRAMQMKSDVEYFRNDIFSAIELPYGKGNFVMDVLLPSGDHSVSDVTAWLVDNNDGSWLENFSEARDLLVKLPKFKFKYETLLNEALKDMGLDIAFTRAADFSGMLEKLKSLAISRVIHKTYIDVNEKGTEAAAVTGVEISYTSVREPSSFIVDKPFLFIIRESGTGAVLFTGKVGRPDS